jgi:hypothetical protein
MRKLVCVLVMSVVFSVCADCFPQQSQLPVLELSGTVLSKTKTEFKVYERVKVGLSRTHTFQITDNTIFYGLVIPSVFVTVRFTQKKLRPGLFIRTAVEVMGYKQ